MSGIEPKQDQILPPPIEFRDPPPPPPPHAYLKTPQPPKEFRYSPAVPKRPDIWIPFETYEKKRPVGVVSPFMLTLKKM